MTDPEVRILTVRQPWAWAIVQGGKDVENRTQNIAGDYRGLVAIHAALGWSEQGAADWEIRRSVASDVLGWPASDEEVWSADSVDQDDPRYTRGHILGVVELTDVHPAGSRYEQIAPGVSQCTSDVCCGAWAMRGHQHLVLANARPLTAPIPYTGALGLRRLPDDIAAQVLASA